MTEQNTEGTGMFTRHSSKESYEEQLRMLPPSRKLALHSTLPLGKGLLLISADVRYIEEDAYTPKAPDCQYFAIARAKGMSYDRVYASVVLPRQKAAEMLAYLQGRLDGHEDEVEDSEEQFASKLLEDADRYAWAREGGRR